MLYIIVIHTGIGPMYYSGIYAYDDWTKHKGESKKYTSFEEAKSLADRIGASVERY